MHGAFKANWKKLQNYKFENNIVFSDIKSREKIFSKTFIIFEIMSVLLEIDHPIGTV